MTGGNPDKEHKVEAPKVKAPKSPLKQFQAAGQEVIKGLSPPPVSRASKPVGFSEIVRKMQEAPKKGTVAELMSMFNVPNTNPNPKLANVVKQAMAAKPKEQPINPELPIAKPPEGSYMNMSGSPSSSYTEEEPNLVSKPVITVEDPVSAYEIIKNNPKNLIRAINPQGRYISTTPPPVPTTLRPPQSPRPPASLPETKSSQFPESLSFNPTAENVFTRKDYEALKRQTGNREGALAGLVNKMKKQKPNLNLENLTQNISKIAGKRIAKANTGIRLSPFKRDVLSAKNTSVIETAFRKNIKKTNPLYSGD